MGRPRERVRTQRERKGEKREDHGWRTLSTRRTSRWNDGVRVRHQRASSSRHMSEDKAQTGYTKWNSNNGGHNQYRRTVERWNTRKEELIDDITNHGDWVEVSRKRKTKMAASRGRMERNSCQGKEKKMTWRNKDDVTTFYFSRFPEGIMEQDMWQIFQKWGKVWEVFIPRTKNKLGHRFGFVRFKEVVDVQSLERRLDNNIFIGGQKLFVNRPKFDRGKVFCTQETGTVTRGMGDAQQVYKGAQMDKRTSVKEGRPRSYAEVVKEFEPGQTSSLNLVEGAHRAEKDNHRPMILCSNKENTEWLHKAWVGRLNNRGMFERVEEELKWVVEDDVNPCYWVDDWVLFPHMEESRAARLIHQEKENGSTPISELQKWSPKIRPTHRLTWVLLWGLPPTVWEVDYMAKVLVDVSEVV